MKIQFTVNASIRDDKGYVAEKVNAYQAAISLDGILADIKAASGFDATAIVQAGIQKGIAEIDANDLIPGDGKIEEGIHVDQKAKADIWFIHIRDTVHGQGDVTVELV